MDKWVWYCDSCDILSDIVITREAAEEQGYMHQEVDGDEDCMVIISPPEIYSTVVMAELLGAGRI